MIGFSIFFSLILAGAALTLYRLLRGPTVPDRVAALDILNVMITSAIVLFSLIDGNSLFLDIALVYAALSFLETIVIARYLEGRR